MNLVIVTSVTPPGASSWQSVVGEPFNMFSQAANRIAGHAFATAKRVAANTVRLTMRFWKGVDTFDEQQYVQVLDLAAAVGVKVSCPLTGSINSFGDVEQCWAPAIPSSLFLLLETALRHAKSAPYSAATEHLDCRR